MEGLLDSERRGLRQVEQAGFLQRRGERARISGGEELRQPGTQGGIVAQQVLDFLALCADRRAPTAAAQVGLEVPLEQVLEEPRQAVAQFAAGGVAGGFDLLGEIQPIQVDVVDRLTGRALTQQLRLLLSPEGEVLVVDIAHGVKSADRLRGSRICQGVILAAEHISQMTQAHRVKYGATDFHAAKSGETAPSQRVG